MVLSLIRETWEISGEMDLAPVVRLYVCMYSMYVKDSDSQTWHGRLDFEMDK